LKGTAEPKVDARVAAPALTDPLDLPEEPIKEISLTKGAPWGWVGAQVDFTPLEAEIIGEGRGEKVSLFMRQRLTDSKGELGVNVWPTRYPSEALRVKEEAPWDTGAAQL
jgi:hypothetical protein